MTGAPSGRYGGATYEPHRPDDPDSDKGRLDRQYAAVWDAMSDDTWHTLDEIASITGASPQSVSARLRDFRKPQNGGHTVDRMYVSRGLFAYRLTPRTDPEVEPVAGQLDLWR